MIAQIQVVADFGIARIWGAAVLRPYTCGWRDINYLSLPPPGKNAGWKPALPNVL
jgi:hypothetical protein